MHRFLAQSLQPVAVVADSGPETPDYLVVLEVAVPVRIVAPALVARLLQQVKVMRAGQALMDVLLVGVVAQVLLVQLVEQLRVPVAQGVLVLALVLVELLQPMLAVVVAV